MTCRQQSWYQIPGDNYNIVRTASDEKNSSTTISAPAPQGRALTFNFNRAADNNHRHSEQRRHDVNNIRYGRNTQIKAGPPFS